MTEGQKKEIIEKVASLSPAEQEVLINVIRGMEIAKSIREESHEKEKKEKAG